MVSEAIFGGSVGFSWPPSSGNHSPLTKKGGKEKRFGQMYHTISKMQHDETNWVKVRNFLLLPAIRYILDKKAIEIGRFIL